MVIQKLEPSQHRAGRWLVWFEDGSLLRVSEGDVVAHALYAGKELTEQEGAALTAAAGQSKLNERAVEILSARPMSRKELVDRLTAPKPRKKRGEGQPEPSPEALERERERVKISAEAAANRLEELGLINDEEYARTVVRHYAAKGFGVRRIRDELYRRGVPREFWDDALAELETDDDTLDKLVEKKLRGGEPTRENLKKVSDYLVRRGFGWEEISSALSRYGAEWEE